MERCPCRPRPIPEESAYPRYTWSDGDRVPELTKARLFFGLNGAVPAKREAEVRIILKKAHKIFGLTVPLMYARFLALVEVECACKREFYAPIPIPLMTLSYRLNADFPEEYSACHVPFCSGFMVDRGWEIRIGVKNLISEPVGFCGFFETITHQDP